MTVAREAIPRLRALLLAGTVLFSFLPAARAEVAAQLRGSDQPPAFYVLAIVDGTDPIGAWTPFNGSGGNRRLLNGSGDANGDGPPSIVVSATGSALAVWSANTPNGFDVVASRFVADDWEAPVTLAGSVFDELDPFAVADPATGEVHVFYWIDDPTPRVLHRRSTPDLASWSAPMQVSLVGELAFRPGAVFHRGTLKVVYEAHDLGPGTIPRRIVMADWNGAGFGSHAPVVVTGHGGPNWPRVHGSRGRVWVDWIDGSGQMGGVRRIGGGAWETLPAEAFVDTEDLEYHVRGRIRSKALE